MIGTQILQGQGLGNRLFCYVTTRSIAEQKKTSFGVPGKEILLNGMMIIMVLCMNTKMTL